MFTFNEYGQTKYRPLYSKIFVQFGFKTFVQPSSIQPELFDKYCFKFVPFANLEHRIGNDTYLTDVVGFLRAWGPFQGSVGKYQGCNPQLRKIVIVDISDIKLNVSLWGKCPLTYDDNVIESKKDTNIVVVLTCCKVGCRWTGVKVDGPFSFTLGTESDELKVTTITDIYKRLANGVTLVQVSNKGSVQKLVYSDLSISSEDNYCDTTDYAIHDENLGSTITEYEEKLMDELEWGHDVYRLKRSATHICTNEGPHAPNTTTNDVIVNDPNKGKAIVDTKLVVVETHVNDFTHDESSSFPELASHVNKVACPPSSPTIESDEMPTHGDIDNTRMYVDEAATNQHVDMMQDD
ncbi:replication protein A 70 kDa DNA-binding subunit B [Tanacetum coccineum]